MEQGNAAKAERRGGCGAGAGAPAQVRATRRRDGAGALGGKSRRTPAPEKGTPSDDCFVRTDLLPIISSESSQARGFRKLPWSPRRLTLFRERSRSWLQATAVPARRATARAGDPAQVRATRRRDGAGVPGGKLTRTPAHRKSGAQGRLSRRDRPLPIITRESPLLSWVRFCVGWLTWLGAATRSSSWADRARRAGQRPACQRGASARRPSSTPQPSRRGTRGPRFRPT
jgi:hypothetical protein